MPQSLRIQKKTGEIAKYVLLGLLQAHLFLTPAYSQESKSDSLLQALKQAPNDSIVLQVLLELATESEENDVEKYMDRIWDLASKSKNQLAQARYFKIKGDLLFRKEEKTKAFEAYNQSLAILDSTNQPRLESEFRYEVGVKQLGVGMYQECLANFSKVVSHQLQSGDTAQVIVTLGRMANAYQRKGDYPASIRTSERGLSLAKSINDPLRAALSLNNLGVAYRNKGDAKKALTYYYEALSFAREGENTFYQAAFLENIGIVHSNRGEYVESLRSYLVAQKLYESMDDKESMIILGFNIGLIYKLNKEYDKAIPFYEQSLEYDISNSDTIGIIYSLHNLGSAYLEMKNWQKARAYLLDSYILSLSSQIECLDGIGGLLGKLYFKLDNLDSAKYFLNLEMDSFQSCEAHSDYPEVAYLLGMVAQKEGKHQNAYRLFRESYELALEAGYQEIIKNSSRALYEWHKVNGNPTKALMFHEVFQQTVDSLFNQENTRELAWLEANFEMGQLTDSLQRIQDQELLAYQENLQTQKRKQRNLWIFIGALSLLAALIYLYIRKRQELKYQVMLDSERQKGFTATIEATEEERKRIAKDLHDGVVQQIGSIKLMLHQISTNLSGNQALEVDEVAMLAEKAADETRHLSHQMMPKALIEVGLLPAMMDVVNNQLQPLGITSDFQHFKLKDRYETAVEVSLYRIFQELANNIVKHAKASHVDIQLMENSGKLILIIEDNGEGMKDQRSDGIGLTNIRSRLSTIDGKVDFTSSPEAGTVATIVIPV